jgi:hypothetical protein
LYAKSNSVRLELGDVHCMSVERTGASIYASRARVGERPAPSPGEAGRVMMKLQHPTGLTVNMMAMPRRMSLAMMLIKA